MSEYILGELPWTRRRFAPDTLNQWNEPVTGGFVDDTILISIQPLSGRDLQALPEGQRVEGIFKGYCHPEDDVRAMDQNAGLKADHIFYQGYWHEVQQTQPYDSIYENVKIRMVRIWPR